MAEPVGPDPEASRSLDICVHDYLRHSGWQRAADAFQQEMELPSTLLLPPADPDAAGTPSLLEEWWQLSRRLSGIKESVRAHAGAPAEGTGSLPLAPLRSLLPAPVGAPASSPVLDAAAAHRLADARRAMQVAQRTAEAAAPRLDPSDATRLLASAEEALAAVEQAAAARGGSSPQVTEAQIASALQAQAELLQRGPLMQVPPAPVVPTPPPVAPVAPAMPSTTAARVAAKQPRKRPRSAAAASSASSAAAGGASSGPPPPRRGRQKQQSAGFDAVAANVAEAWTAVPDEEETRRQLAQLQQRLAQQAQLQDEIARLQRQNEVAIQRQELEAEGSKQSKKQKRTADDVQEQETLLEQRQVALKLQLEKSKQLLSLLAQNPPCAPSPPV